LPLRRKGGAYEVLLITTRRNERWIIPKGIVEPDLTPAASAEKEAWEEAGVRGRVEKPALGTYSYAKWGGSCVVKVFVMYVSEVLDAWPESERKRRWMGLREAERLVDEAGLKKLLRRVRKHGRAARKA